MLKKQIGSGKFVFHVWDLVYTHSGEYISILTNIVQFKQSPIINHWGTMD